MRLPALEARCSVDWPRRSHYSYRHVLTMQRTQLQPVHTTYERPMQIKPESGFLAQACRPRKRERGLCSALRCGLASREMSASSEMSHLTRVSNCHSVCCRVSTPCVLSEVVLLAPSGARLQDQRVTTDMCGLETWALSRQAAAGALAILHLATSPVGNAVCLALECPQSRDMHT